MFAESVILRKLESFKKRFGWLPQYHSVEEVDQFVEHLKSATYEDQKGKIYLKRRLTKKEKRFILNERALCIIDCAYFLTRYYWISSDNKLMHFSFRSGQLVLYRILQELDEMGVSKELQVLKGRQQGISTLIEGIMTWGSLFIPGVKAAIASADGQKSQVMMGMMLLAIDQLPWWLPPTQTRDKRSSDRAILEFSNIGSLIMVQSGSMRGGIGQGTTPTFVHLSEVSQFTDPETQIEEGLFKAIHPSPEIFMVLESTGDAVHPWWTKLWESNKEFYWQGKARHLPVFIPWHMTPELFPGPGFLKKYPMPHGWIPNAHTEAHAAKCNAYVANTEMLQRILGKDWKLPREQQWFWEFNYEDAKRRGVEKSWERQMPGDDYEALIGKNDKVYPVEVINRLEEGITKGNDLQFYAVVGEGVEKAHEPQQSSILYGDDARRIWTDWTTPKEEELEWGLIPLMRYGVEKPGWEPLKKVLIFEEVQPHEDYSIGVDCGTGVGGDRSVICVTKTGHDAGCDVQVAEFAADDISNAEIYAWVAAIVAYYARFMPQGKHPKLIIEQRRKFGDLCQHQLRLMGMKRMHEFVRYDKKTFREKESSGRAAIGWYTNEWSRPMLLSLFKFAIENGWYVPKSQWLVAELRDHEQQIAESGKTKMDHKSGKHDDRIFAAAMSYFTLHHKDVMAERSKKRYNIQENETIIIDKRPYSVEVHVGGEKLWGTLSKADMEKYNIERYSFTS